MVPDEQLAAHLAGTLTPEAGAALEEQLLADPDALRRFVAQQRLDAALLALLDPQAQQREAGIMAGVRGITDEAAEERVLEETVRTARKQNARKHNYRWRWPAWKPAWGFIGVAAILVGVAAIGLRWKSAEPRRLAAIARVVEIKDARQPAPAPGLKAGDVLDSGPFELEAGLVQLEFAKGVVVAVEGPARLTLADYSLVELEAGRLSAEVPKPAAGFTVKTPAATLVDLGTRFGVSAVSNEPCEFHVFEGQVRVAAGKGGSPPQELAAGQAVAMAIDGTATRKPASAGAFPQLAKARQVHAANCGFESAGDLRRGTVPAGFGFWSCNAGRATGPQQGVRPQAQKFMLQFLHPDARPNDSASGKTAAVWQLLDLRPVRQELGGGPLEVSWCAVFNRAAARDSSAGVFGVALAAFRGRPADAPALWPRRREAALAFSEQDMTADQNPATWEKVKTAATLVPPEADFLVLELRATAPETVAAGVNPFTGHFADSAFLEVSVPLRPSNPVVAR